MNELNIITTPEQQEFYIVVNHGPEGVAGEPGSQGLPGEQGPIGYTGSAGADSTVPGPAGYTGSQGVKGDTGYTGSAGLDSTVPGPQGIQGTQGYTGSKGADGTIGVDGAQGPQGYTGSAGAKGDTGYTGSAGANGTAIGAKFNIDTTSTLPSGLPSGAIRFDTNNWGTVSTLYISFYDVTGSTPGYWGGGGLVDIQTGTIIYMPMTDGTYAEFYANTWADSLPDGWSISVIPVRTPAGFAGVVQPTQTYVTYATPQVGFTGSTGAQGNVGYTGSTGSTGPAGADGAVGFTGSVGYTGSAGAQGVTGYTGSAGADSTVPGPQGSIGYTGSAGAQGPIGYTGSQGGNTVTVSSPAYSATMSVDITNVDVIRITLTGNLTLGFSGGVDGQKVIVELTQDATGSRTLAYDSSVIFGTDLTSTTLTTTAAKTDRIGFIYNATAAKYAVLAFIKGY